MARDRMIKTWVKLNCQGMLTGSINYLFVNGGIDISKIQPEYLISLACQAVWVKMIAFSEMSGGRSGYIEDNNHHGLPHLYIAQELKCPIELFVFVLDKMKKDNAITVDELGSIHLVNFDKYQYSEYDRQRMYRDNKRGGREASDEKKPYGEFQNVFLMDAELRKLNEKFGEKGAGEKIRNLSEQIESKGYRYKSHYATILTWDRKDVREGKAGGTHRRDDKAHGTSSQGAQRNYQGGRFGSVVKS